MICNNCNNDVKEGNFCEVCGASLTKDENSNSITCPRCKNVVSKDNFCEKCGYNLQSIESETSDISTKEYTVTDNLVVSEEPITIKNPNNSNTIFKEHSNEKKLNKKILTIISSLILGIIIISGSVLAILKYNNQTANKTADNDGTIPTNSSNYVNDTSKEILDLEVGQVDTSSYPLIKLYLSTKNNGKDFTESLDSNNVSLQEKCTDSFNEIPIKDIKRLSDNELLNINLVMDTSSSMDSSNLLNTCKDAAKRILNNLDFNNTQVGVISFNTKVKLTSYLTNNMDSLNNAISALRANGNTALYDALMLSLDETAKNNGGKLIIAFTDGLDNESKSSADDVIQKSKLLGIPIYIVALINENENDSILDIQRISNETNGQFVELDNITKLESLYTELVTKTKNQYVITYESKLPEKETLPHNVKLNVSDNKYTGNLETSFLLQPKNLRLNIPKFENQKKYAKELNDKYLNTIEGNKSMYFGDIKMGSPLIINDKPIRSASTIKLFIMIETMQQIEDGKLNENSKFTIKKDNIVGGTGILQHKEVGSQYTVKELLEYMMTESDNMAANMLIDAVGGVSKVNDCIKSLGCVNSQMNRKLLDTTALSQGKDNYVTAYDMGNILTRIYNKQCVSKSADEYMLSLMARNTNHKKIPAELPEGTKVYNKTGEYDEYGVQNDVAIIETASGTYVLCLLTEDGNRDEEVNAIINLSKDLYNNYTK